MASLGANIKRIRKLRGLTQAELATRTSLSRSYLADVERDRYNPSVETLTLIADALQISTDYLLGQSIGAVIEKRLDELNMSLQDLSRKTGIPLKNLQGLDYAQPAPWDYEPGNLIDQLSAALRIDRKVLVAAYVRQEPPAYDGPHSTVEEDFADEGFDMSLANSAVRENRPAVYPLGARVRIPIIGTVTAGLTGLAFEEQLGTEFVDQDDLRSGEYYWLKVKGDSMIGEGIFDGDLALFRVQPEVENGELAVVVIDGEIGCLKRVYFKDGGIVLQSSNPAYPPRIFVGRETALVRIVGRVKEIKRKF
ncbi:MAG: helix-turn-helix domain-containing protein [Alicyclobacillus sp.]|nr:helix-turn-helix domain-containing protein [Alicyclobacillus sp.]